MTAPRTIARIALLAALLALVFVPGVPDAVASPHWDRVRDYDVLHTRLEVSFRWEDRAVVGRVVHRLRPLRDGLRELHFDQHRMTFHRVGIEGGPDLVWRTLGDTLTVTLPEPAPRDREMAIEIVYEVVDPPEGVNWNIPDRHYPERAQQIWTQGEETENHFWFPCYDAPNERMTSESVITMESKYTALGNGELVERRDNDDGTTTWHYRMEVPHVPYLLSVVVGEFAVLEQEADGVPILSYVVPKRLNLARHSFRRMPEMMRIFNERFGPYPYPVYRQSTLEDYLFGGMENITNTTLTHRTLHDEVGGQGYSSEGLLAHELGHQWFGDLVTTRNWANIWLNEGFAAYTEMVFFEFADGKDRMLWDQWSNLGSYVRSGSRRPLVTRDYTRPGVLFDSVSYSKGAVVLHMLRHRMGDDLFWELLKSLAEQHGGESIVSEDLRRLAERLSGIPLDRFFHDWVYSGGHPQLVLSWSWDPSVSLIHVTVKQTQDTSQGVPLFELPVQLHLTGPDWEEVFPLRVSQAEQEFFFKVPGIPDFVELDRDEQVVKELEIRQSASALIVQLERSPALISRVRAAQALGKKGGAKVEAALNAVLQDESEFYGLRGACADALGDLGTDNARDLLFAARDISPVRVRVQVIEALGHVADDDILDRLVRTALGDASPHVAEAATSAIATADADRSGELLVRILKRDSWNDIVRRQALAGLRSLGDPAYLDAVTPFLRPGVFGRTRSGALSTAGSLGAELDPDDPAVDRLRRRIEPHLEDNLLIVRSAAARALSRLGDPKAIPALERAAQRDDHGGVVRAARSAIRNLRSDRPRGADVADLKRELESLRRANEELEQQFERFRERSKARETEAASPASPEGP